MIKFLAFSALGRLGLDLSWKLLNCPNEIYDRFQPAAEFNENQVFHILIRAGKIFIKNSTGNFSVVNFLLQRLKGTSLEGIVVNTKLIHGRLAITDNIYLRQKEYLSA